VALSNRLIEFTIPRLLILEPICLTPPAQCMQTWCGNDDFFYCHWIAESEDDVYQQLNAFELEGKVVNSRVSEMHQFMSAYRASDEIMRQYPDEGGKWD